MRTPIYVRKLTKREKLAVQAGVRHKDPFVIRRSQIVLAGERGEKAIDIARTLGCDDQTARNVIKGFNQSGIAVLKEGSRRPHTTQAAFSSEEGETVRATLKRFGMKWSRAKHWITSPDPDYERKKTTEPFDKNGAIPAKTFVLPVSPP